VKIEISNSDDTFRLVDGEEGTDSYLTGTVEPYGGRSYLDEISPGVESDCACEGFAVPEVSR